MERQIKVLAVGDPAVEAYVNPKYSLVERINRNFSCRISFHIIPWDQYYGKMMEAFALDEFDIVMVAGHLWLKDFVKKEFLAKVEYPDTKDFDQEDILETIHNEMKVDNSYYLYPSFCDGHILLYRKSIVNKVIGDVLPEVVDTDTVISLAEKCDGMRGLCLKAHQSEIFTDFLPYLRNEGIDAYDINGVPTFNNEKGINSLYKYLSLKKWAPKHTFRYGNEEVRQAFQQKDVVLATTWGGQLGTVLDKRCLELDDVGFSALKTSWNVTWSFGINNLSKNKELSNEILSYLSSKEIDRIIGGIAGSPVRKSTYLVDSAKYNWYKIHLCLIEKYAKPLPMINNSGEKQAYIYEHLYNVFVGKETPEKALESAENSMLGLRN
ncbi:extracellular solute-binding protein [Bacillaceae bacterium S4-13-58]